MIDIDQIVFPIYSGTFVTPVDLLFYHTVRWGGCLEPDLAMMMMMISNTM